MDIDTLFSALGLKEENSGAFNGVWLKTSGSELEAYSPIDGGLLGKVIQAGADDYDAVIQSAEKAFGVYCLLRCGGILSGKSAWNLENTKINWVRWSLLKWGKLKRKGMGKFRRSLIFATSPWVCPANYTGSPCIVNGPTAGCMSNGIHSGFSDSSPPSIFPPLFGDGISPLPRSAAM